MLFLWKKEKKNREKKVLGWISRVLLWSVSMSSLSPFHLSQQASGDISFADSFAVSHLELEAKKRAEGNQENKSRKTGCILFFSVKGAIRCKKKEKKEKQQFWDLSLLKGTDASLTDSEYSTLGERVFVLTSLLRYSPSRVFDLWSLTWLFLKTERFLWD